MTFQRCEWEERDGEEEENNNIFQRTGRMLIESERPKSLPQKLLVSLTRLFALFKSVSESFDTFVEIVEFFLSDVFGGDPIELEELPTDFAMSISSLGIRSIHVPNHFKQRLTEARLCAFVRENRA